MNVDIWRTALVVLIEQFVRCVCVCLPVWIRVCNFEGNNFWPRYLACWFDLTLTRLISKVKTTGLRSSPYESVPFGCGWTLRGVVVILFHQTCTQHLRNLLVVCWIRYATSGRCNLEWGLSSGHLSRPLSLIRSPVILSFIFFLTVSLETTYLRIYCTNLHQIFRIGVHMGEHDQSDLLLALERCYDNWFFGANLRKLAYILCASIPQPMGEIATRMRALTSPMIPLRSIRIRWTLVHWPCVLQGGLRRVGFATHV